MPVRVPVIALTGHLGAGKTSLLNHLLRAPGARLGVVVNDFGELNVDAALVSGQVDEAASISGGCLCCLPDAGGLDEALRRLAQPRLHLDAILVEASGAADPLALSRIIGSSEVGTVRHGGAIEVIDAVTHFQTVDARETPPNRFAAASLVVIGKADLLADQDREAVVGRICERVRARNPDVPIVQAVRGGIDPALVFDTAADDDPVDQLPLARLMREQSAEQHDHDHAQAVSVALEHPVAPGALVELLEDPPRGAYRLKGRVRVHGSRGRSGFRVDVVGPMIHVARLPEPSEPGELVVVGLDLDADDARRRLQEVAASQPSSADAAGLRQLTRLQRLSR
ncbi:CobW family GTP-binding protein [Kocuria palustris]|uniref:CobW family GTP-binding protein n=1 Tax=Kocuria palustris TaxID=71999 RepID=UPI003D724C04